MTDLWDGFLGLSLVVQRHLAVLVTAQYVAGGQGDWRELVERERAALERLPTNPDGIPAHLIPAALPADPDAFVEPAVEPEVVAEPTPGWEEDDETALARAIRASLGEPDVGPQVLLREQQDSAYLESLQEDARKQQVRDAEERRAMQDEEERAMLEAIRMSQMEDADRELQQLRASLPAEPAENTDGVCALAIRMPSGERVHRRMLADHTIGTLRNFVRAQLLQESGAHHVGASRITIAMDYPRRRFDDDAATLRAAGMCPRAAVLVVLEDQ